MLENENEKTVRPIGERLRELMEYYHLNMNSLSIKMGLDSNSVITRVVNDPKRGMSLDYIQRVLKVFPEISEAWMVMDRGEMLIKKETHKPGNETGPCIPCTQKEEMISNLRAIIKSKDEVIASKEEFIEHPKGGIQLGKKIASG